MVEVYEKHLDEEVKRVVYSVLTAEEKAIIEDKSRVDMEAIVMDIKHKLSQNLACLIKVDADQRGKCVELKAYIHLPYIENMIVVRLRESEKYLLERTKELQKKIDELREEAENNSLPWYKKIWR